MIKECLKCGNNSLKSIFRKNKNMSDGLTPHCKPCAKVYRRKIYEKNYDSEKKYRLENKECIKQKY